MFNKDFYPTPKDVIYQMLETAGLDIKDKTILEPSAGKGDIVDILNEQGAKAVLTCEINPDLATILKSKSNYIAEDFLTLKSSDISHVDYIIMNPPFSKDIQHILHAYEIAPQGCEVISLCNNTSLSGRNKKERELTNLISQKGYTMNFGDCFRSSERKTNVTVGFVHLQKPNEGNTNEFEGYFDLDDGIDIDREDGIVQYSYIQDIVSRYVQAVSMYDSAMEINSRINDITRPITKYGIVFGAFKKGSLSYDLIDRETYKKELQKQCWHKVFIDMKLEKHITSDAQDTINSFVEEQTHIPFTVKNIYRMGEMIIGTQKARMEKAIVKAFETIALHSDEHSNDFYEKWKTNSIHTIGKKFIIPYLCTVGYRGDPTYNIGTRRKYDQVDDMVKVLCYLTGTPYDVKEMNILDAIKKLTWGQWGDFASFFKIKPYKKGTIHFQFIDTKTADLLNQKIAEINGWALPKKTRNK